MSITAGRQVFGLHPCESRGLDESCADCRSLRKKYPNGYLYPPGVPLEVPAGAGMPCSDCCHSMFGLVRLGCQRITANWPCQGCGRTIGQIGGYHYRETCGTPMPEREVS